MSVPRTWRKENKLDVLVHAEELMVYTLQITSNKNIFLPQYDASFTSIITNRVVIIFELCWEANDIRVCTKEDRTRRLALQRKALHLTKLLEADITLAAKLFHLREQRLYNWISLANFTGRLIRSWNESDQKRWLDLK